MVSILCKHLPAHSLRDRVKSGESEGENYIKSGIVMTSGK